MSRACDKTHRLGKPKRRERTPQYWFEHQMDGCSVIASKRPAARAFDNPDLFVSIQRRNRTRPYRFEGHLCGRSMIASKGLATRAFDNPNPWAKLQRGNSTVDCSRTSCVCYDPLKDAAEAGWWPLPHKPDRTKIGIGARSPGRPPTPPSKRVRTRRFAPWQQACSRYQIDSPVRTS